MIVDGTTNSPESHNERDLKYLPSSEKYSKISKVNICYERKSSTLNLANYHIEYISLGHIPLMEVLLAVLTSKNSHHSSHLIKFLAQQKEGLLDATGHIP